MYIQLVNTQGNILLGSDGVMNVDGRFNLYSIANAVRERNKLYEKNFPHLVAAGFAKFKGNKISNDLQTKFYL